ncbi:MAG: 1-acyl-sn-glycerol-3-phosphate acyltransferase [Clostridia bacterium]|nr:1-acyl-sn-glycerol-3-phosphate acyltransferase [Clostridia bacterium]
MRVRVIGKQNFPPEDVPLVLCCNHISNWDPVFLVVAHPKRHVFFMAKAELFSNRLFTWFLGKQLGAFPVHRGTGDTSAIETAKRLVNERKLMGIFPEGTRSRDGKLLRAKSGVALIVAQTGASVLPVAVVTRGQKIRPFQRVTIVYGSPLSPEDLHLTDPEHPDIRYATRLIMKTIGELIETNG